MLPKYTYKLWSGKNSIQKMEERSVSSNHPNKLLGARVVPLMPSCNSTFLSHWLYGSVDPGIVSNSGSIFKGQGTARYSNQKTSRKNYRSVHNVQTTLTNGLTMDDKSATFATHNVTNYNVKYKPCMSKLGGSNGRRIRKYSSKNSDDPLQEDPLP